MARSLPSANFTFSFPLRLRRLGARFFRFARTARFSRLGWFRFYWLAVPFGVGKMVICIHEVVDSEIFFTVKKARSAADDLLEFDHGIYRAHQNDIADIARVNTSGKLLRSSQNGRNGLFVVLKFPQVLFADSRIICSDSHAIIRVFTFFKLVDQIPNDSCMRLIGTEDNRLLFLVNLVQENIDTVRFTFANLNNPVEIMLLILVAFFTPLR